MKRVGTGRYAGLSADRAGDPLDGLVNLFDLAIVLAVGFLIAALGSLGLTGVLTREDSAQRLSQAVRQGAPQPVPLPGVPAAGPTAAGQGTALGTVYQLADGRLVYVGSQGGAPAGSTPAPPGAGGAATTPPAAGTPATPPRTPYTAPPVTTPPPQQTPNPGGGLPPPP